MEVSLDEKVFSLHPLPKKQATRCRNPKSVSQISSLNIIVVENEIREIEEQLKALMVKRDELYEKRDELYDELKTDDIRNGYFY